MLSQITPILLHKIAIQSFWYLQISLQTGVAQRHYNKERHKRERMPGMKFGQIYSYPQRNWRKKKYQYLEHFMKPVNQAFEPESEMHTISQIENPAAEKPVVSSTSTNFTTTNSTGKNFYLFEV